MNTVPTFLNLGSAGGFSLLSTALIVMALGLFTVPAVQLYRVAEERERLVTTAARMDAIDGALRRYATEHGRYPCAAPLDAALDAPEFGREVVADCTQGDHPGTFRAAGETGGVVRTGAVPVRTLGLPDELIADAWSHRFVYAVSEKHAGPDADLSQTGAISVNDGAGNSATSPPGGIVYLVLSPGRDPRGAYTLAGVPVDACDPAGKAGANCAFGGTFTNTLWHSHREDMGRFTHRMVYRGPMQPPPCNTDTYDDVIYLLDTSNSMRWKLLGPNQQLPERLEDSRINVARAALREVMKAHLTREMADDEDFDLVGYTGFDFREPQYSDDSAFFDPAFVEEEALARAGDPQPLLDALTAHGNGDPDINGDGKVDDDDLKAARVDIAGNDLDEEIGTAPCTSGISRQGSGRSKSDCTTQGTPLIKTAQAQARTLLAGATAKTCRQLAASGKIGLPAACGDAEAEYSADPVAFRAKYDPEPLDDADGDGKYDVEANAIIVISDGDDTEVPHPKSGLTAIQLRDQSNDPRKKDKAIEQIRDIYRTAGERMLAMLEDYNRIFAAFGLAERALEIHVIDVVGNPGLEELATVMNGQRILPQTDRQLTDQMKFLARVECR